MRGRRGGRRREKSETWDNDKIALLFEQYGLGGFVREYAVKNPATNRSFHVDFVWNWPSIRNKDGTMAHAWPVGNGRRVAVEYQGGITVGGYHFSITNYARDCRKSRLLQLLGFTALPFTVLDMQSPALVIAEVKAALGLIPVEDVVKLMRLAG